MEVKEDKFVFQADSDVVEQVFSNCDNYVIEYNNAVANKNYCIIYFSSNDLYYPNTTEQFNKNVIEKNKFEWYRTRVSFGYKHIFIRDIKKQWYVNGINGKINTPVKLFEFLKNETAGYKIITIGSSAGGYASVLYGQLLSADISYCFNGQFTLNTLFERSTEKIDPLIFRNKNNKEIGIYFDTLNFIKTPKSIYYFYSTKSNVDIEQVNHVKLAGINILGFRTAHHGIPFLKNNLVKVLQLTTEELNSLAKRTHNPFIFSVRMVGLNATLRGIYSQLTQKFL